uniref:Uncharacterized protein n=1 Tax=Oncorhynchus kisutch TaxID=8019 RepID=A0A8C7CJC8_ONCKI
LFFCLLGFPFHLIFSPQYLAYLVIHSLVQQGAIQGKTAHELMDHSLSELIDISLAQTSSIWMMYGKSNVNHNSLCHLAELHGLYGAVSEVLKHLKEQFPPHTQHAKVSCWLVVVAQHPVKTLYVGVSFILAVYLCMCCVNRKAQVPKALNRTTKAYGILQRLQLYCEKTKYSEMSIRWARTLNKNTRPQLQNKEIHTGLYLKTPSIVCVVFCLPVQLILGVLEQTLSVMDKGRALLLPARCQVATAGSQPSLGLAMQTLVEAVAYFSMLDCKGRLWDIHYLQARMHHTLGQTPPNATNVPSCSTCWSCSRRHATLNSHHHPNTDRYIYWCTLFVMNFTFHAIFCFKLLH